MSNPSRRGLLGSIAVLASAPVVMAKAAPVAPVSPDAELIEACAEAARLEAHRQNINAKGVSDDECNECLDAWWAAFRHLEELPATTLEGIRAKAAALRLAVRERVIEGPDYTMEDAEMHERLAVSLCDDILAKETTA